MTTKTMHLVASLTMTALMVFLAALSTEPAWAVAYALIACLWAFSAGLRFVDWWEER